MKLIDCTTYYDEELILDLRFNMLNQYIDKFIVCEAKFTHSGRRKKLNFDINKFSKFKDKIIYLVVEREPKNLIYENKESKLESDSDLRINSAKRIAFQRNKLLEAINNIAEPNDYIFYSDNDEIPNLSEFDLEKTNSRIIIFEQKLFYYKFNLHLDRIHWHGTRALKKKNLTTFQELREIKPKKYSFYRLDTLFKKNKFMDINIIKNGGWHFTRILSPQEIHNRELETEHSDEYIQAKKNSKKIEDLINRKVIDHDHLADKKEYKFNKEFKLKTLSINQLPIYIQDNVAKYSNYLDLE